VPWIWETVRGGFVMNWWARAGWEIISVSVMESGVEVSERRVESACAGDSVASSSGVADISPGATVEIVSLELVAFPRGSRGTASGLRRRGCVVDVCERPTDEFLRAKMPFVLRHCWV
jgi:hypothetical protein